MVRMWGIKASVELQSAEFLEESQTSNYKMSAAKYLIVMALLVFCLFCQEAVAHHFGKIGHEVHKAAHKVDKVASHINKAKHAIEVGGAVAGVIAGAAAAA
ncbi:unnamed protein product [Ceratitis capitata]|uniref:(Mediterranean fruit fly) hypothetical protein n=1 Tax=Ceratitis capitata TaxID=7213 RepID=A0A811U1J8_CERCA|nr:unnamed protein product [Ceratitis capitata]